MSKTSILALCFVARHSHHRTIAQRTLGILIDKSILNNNICNGSGAAISPSISSFHTCAYARAIQRIESPNVITVPAAMRKTMEKIKEKEAADDALRIYRRNKGPLIISSDVKDKNHFQNRKYVEFNPELHLASWGWKNHKYHGKKMQIIAHSSHPSFAFDAAKAKQKVRDAPREFASLGLDPEFLAAVENLGFQKPTVIQALAIPKLLQGANILCAAETGSGKTLAYLLPLLQNVVKFAEKFQFKPQNNSPTLLIMVPSKELVYQTEGVMKLLSNVGKLPHDLSVVPLLPDEDGVSVAKRLATKKRVDVVVGVPQLLANLIQLKKIKTNCVQGVVLDEVDTLLDDSFVGATTEVLSHVSLRGVHASRKIHQRDMFMKGISGGSDDGETRTPLSTTSDSSHSPSAMSQSLSSSSSASAQTVSTSSSPEEAVVDLAQLVLVGATLPVGFQERLHRVVDTDSLHRVDTPHLHRLPPHVNHKFFRVQPSLKTEYFLKLMRDSFVKKGCPPTMVFCNKTATVRYLQHILGSEPDFSGSYATLFKDIDETERQRVLDGFHRGAFSLLLCSDLASRGIDTCKAVNVVNYEFPNNVSDYLHRSGRVGRVGSLHHPRLPVIYSLVSHKWEVDVLWKLERAVRKAEVLSDVDANIKQQHVKRHEEKEVERAEQGEEVVEVGGGGGGGEKSTRRSRVVNERKPGLPGSRKLKRFSGASYEF